MLDKREETDFAVLHDNMHRLKVVAHPDVFVGIQVKDRDGKITHDELERGHSWTRNYYMLAFGVVAAPRGGGVNTYGAGYMTTKGANGTNYYSTNYCICGGINAQYNMSALTGNAGTLSGIVVGTGTTAFSVEQTALAAIVAHGNSATQLAYLQTGNQTSAYASKTWTTTWQRFFNNNSGGSIIITETGLYYVGYLIINSDQYFMIERTVLAASATVPYGGQLSVTYNIAMDFSVID